MEVREEEPASPRVLVHYWSERPDEWKPASCIRLMERLVASGASKRAHLRAAGQGGLDGVARGGAAHAAGALVQHVELAGLARLRGHQPVSRRALHAVDAPSGIYVELLLESAGGERRDSD